MNISKLIRNLQYVLDEHGDLTLIDSHQLTNIREAAFRGKTVVHDRSVDVRPVNIHRDAEAEQEEADERLHEAQEHVQQCREEATDLIGDFDPDEYDKTEERRQALEEIAEAGREVAIAEQAESEAAEEASRIENLPDKMTHVVIE